MSNMQEEHKSDTIASQEALPTEQEVLQAVEEEEEQEEGEEIPFEELLETANRHYALREWAEAADRYGQALESV